MKIYKVLPDLSKERQMKIWHKALRSQWSATDLNWDRPQRITNAHLKNQMSRILTPVLMGEQAALYSVSGLIPILGKMSEVESQFYLTTWAVDEARHTELFTLYYDRLGLQPMPIRRFPAGYLFQSQIVADEPAEWLSGVLISEVMAKKLMEEFVRLDLDPVLSDISDGILKDEARHLGFNHIYLEDRFSDLHTNAPDQGQAFAEQLHKRLDHVLEHLQPVLDALATELDDIGIDRIEIFDKVGDEARRRLDKSIQAGHRRAEGKQKASQLAEAELVGA
ncbi:MAG: ferritin-like domain-containing protein [Acidobacteriota bacterium]